MPLAQAPSVGYDLLILSFVGGFALATLIFWPLLHRAHQSRAQPAPTGKHALRKPAKGGATAVAATTSSGRKSRAEQSTSAAEPDSGSGASVPAETTHEPAATVPSQPTSSELFREHYAAQFDHTRSRLAKLRAELAEQYN